MLSVEMDTTWKSLLGALVVLCCLGLSSCNTTPPRTADDEAAVKQTLIDACKAYLEGDVERMTELLTEDFTTTDSSGAITTRADDVEAAKTGSIRYEVFENRDMKVRLHGDAAVVTGRTIVKGQAGGSSFDVEFQFTDTLVRSGGRWRVAATHVSRINR